MKSSTDAMILYPFEMIPDDTRRVVFLCRPRVTDFSGEYEPSPRLLWVRRMSVVLALDVSLKIHL